MFVHIDRRSGHGFTLGDDFDPAAEGNAVGLPLRYDVRLFDRRQSRLECLPGTPAGGECARPVGPESP